MKKYLTIMLLCQSVTIGAQTGTNFSITKSNIAGGGGSSTGSQFSLKGTIGQITTQKSTSTNFEVSGGFWTTDIIFINGFES